MKLMNSHDYNVTAWLLMLSALALHVLDEALSGFLPFYNQMVLNLRTKLGFFPAPTFSHGLWLGGLVAVITAGFMLTPWVKRESKAVRIFTLVLGVLMVANALGHLLGSLYAGRVLPGMWSSPLLLITAGYVVYRGIAGQWSYEQNR